MSDKNLLVIICGPTTTGKSTLAELFQQDGYQVAVTTTTRPPRNGEIEGVNYYFVTDDKFKEMEKNDEFVESAPVGIYWYGLSKIAIKKSFDNGNRVVLVTEPSGGNNVASFCQSQQIEHHKIYLNNSIEELTSRLVYRYNNDSKATAEVYKNRLWDLVFVEPIKWTTPAYSGEHHYHQIFDSFVDDNKKNIYEDICKSIKNRIDISNTTKIKI